MSSSPTSVITGCGGDFQGPAGFSAKFKEWVANFDVETEDTSGFADGAWKNNTPVRVGFTGTASGWLTSDSPIPTLPTDCSVLDSFVGAFVLTADDGKTFAFEGTMTKTGIGRQAHKAGTVNYSFEARGAVTPSWS